MRAIILLAIVSLSACHESSKGQIDAIPAALSFDGAASSDPALLRAHGERLTRVLGCTGCRGTELQGERFYELYASNLTRDLANYSDPQLERLLREGVRPTGRDVWEMPSEMFQHLSQTDMVALIVHLRTLRPTGKMLPFEAETKKLIADGMFKPAAAFVQESRNVGPVDLGTGHALGRYMTRVTWAECHSTKLEGHDDTPNLVVVGAYSRAEFEQLMTKGIAKDNRKIKPLMASVAKGRFAYMTPHERDALYNYLKARAELLQ